MFGFQEVQGAFEFFRFDPDSPVWSIVKYAVTILAAVGAWIAFTERVKAGDEAIRLSFGDVKRYKDGTPKVVKPGLRFMIPIKHKLLATSVQDRITEVTAQVMTAPNGYTYDVRATLSFRVIRLDAALVDYEDVEGQLNMLLSNHLARMLQAGCSLGFIESFLWRDPTLMNLVWLRGVMMMSFKVIYFAPTAETRLAMGLAAAGVFAGSAPEAASVLAVAHQAGPQSNGHAIIGSEPA